MSYTISNVLVLITDGVPDKSGENFDPGCQLQVTDPIPVTFGLSQVGQATCALHGQNSGKVTINLELIDTLMHPADAEKMVPSVVGAVMVRNGKTILNVRVDRIELSLGGNADPRIKNIRDQISTGQTQYGTRGSGVAPNSVKPRLPDIDVDDNFRLSPNWKAVKPAPLGKIRRLCQGGGCGNDLSGYMDAYYGRDARGQTMCSGCRTRNKIQ